MGGHHEYRQGAGSGGEEGQGEESVHNGSRKMQYAGMMLAGLVAGAAVGASLTLVAMHNGGRGRTAELLSRPGRRLKELGRPSHAESVRAIGSIVNIREAAGQLKEKIS